MTRRGGSDRTCPAASSSGESHPSKLPLTPSYPLHQFRELMGRESPGEVSRSLIESPLAEPRGSLRGAAAPALDLFDRCAFLALLLPPPAAQGSSPPLPLPQLRES